jgi:hypothetical protein
VRWGGLLVCAIDGTAMSIPDSPRNLAAYSKQPGNHGGSGYPLLRLVALVACGTRTTIDAVFGPTSCGRRVLDNLLPDRRLRVSPRIVKRAISKFQARGPNINRRSYKATLKINILAAPGP